MSIIGKAESISYGKAAVKYAEEKKINGVEIAEDFELHALSGQTSEECFNEMRNWKNGTGHGNIKRDFLWLSFSPSKELVEQWGDDTGKWKEAHNKWLQYLGVDNSQRMTILHYGSTNDAERTHLHDIINRIDLDGNVIDDGQIGLRAKAAAEKVAREYGLKTAEDIGKEQRGIIKQKARNALRWLKTWSFDGFETACEEQGLKIDRYYQHDQDGNPSVLQGYFLMDGTHRIKVSQIDRNLTLSRIEGEWKKLRQEVIKQEQLKQKQDEQRRIQEETRRSESQRTEPRTEQQEDREPERERERGWQRYFRR